MIKKIAIIIIFIVIILPLILLLIIGADAYLTVTSFSPSNVSLQVGTPVVNLSSDNTTLNFSTQVNITTPKAGFIPKAVDVVMALFYNGTTKLGNSINFNLQLGTKESKTITDSIPLGPEITSAVSQGKSIVLTVKTSATIIVFGITIPYNFKIPDQTFTIP